MKRNPAGLAGLIAAIVLLAVMILLRYVVFPIAPVVGPEPTATIPITVLPAPSSTPLPEMTPTYVTPERLPGLAGTSTPTPIAPGLLLPAPTETPRPPATMVQKGLAP